MEFEEGNDLAEIDLTYSPTRGISRARRVLGRLIVCIIQVIESGRTLSQGPSKSVTFLTPKTSLSFAGPFTALRSTWNVRF